MFRDTLCVCSFVFQLDGSVSSFFTLICEAFHFKQKFTPSILYYNAHYNLFFVFFSSSFRQSFLLVLALESLNVSHLYPIILTLLFTTMFQISVLAFILSNTFSFLFCSFNLQHTPVAHISKVADMFK